MGDLIRTATPESVDLMFQPAGAGSRFVAAVLDGLIQLVLLASITLAAGLMGIALNRFGAAGAGMPAGQAVLLALAAAVVFLYQLIFELVWKGQTPGKRALGLRVLQADGRPADHVQIAGRNLMRVIDFLPLFYSAGVLSLLLTRHNQRLGDLVAGTVVVHEGPLARPLAAVPRPDRPPVAPPVLLRERLSRLQDVELEPVRAFLARREQLAPPVRRSLAERIVNAVCRRMGWDETVAEPEAFLEDLIRVRAGELQSP